MILLAILNLRKLLSNKIVKELDINGLLEDISLVKSNATTTILCECDRNDFYGYIPSENIKPHRMIMTGNFSKLNNSSKVKKNRISCTIEYSGRLSKDQFLELIKPQSKFIAYNFCPNSYIIDASRELINNLKEKLAKKYFFMR